MATTCTQHGKRKEHKEMRASMPQDFSISDYPDPFDNPENVVHYWVTKFGRNKGNKNQKIIKGPDAGVHRFVTPQGRTGQTGISRLKGGKEES